MASCENVVPGVFKQFSNNLVSNLRKCIPSAARGIPNKVQRQHMWSNYHHLISSEPFQDSWALFLKEMGTQSSPTLYQFVTMQLMDVLIKQQFPLPAEPGTHCFVPELSTAEEKCSPVCGWICGKTYMGKNREHWTCYAGSFASWTG